MVSSKKAGANVASKVKKSKQCSKSIESSALSLDELSNIYQRIQSGLEAGEEPKSLESDFGQLTNISQITGPSEMKLASQLIINIYESFPDQIDNTVDAFNHFISTDNCDVRTTVFANLKLLLSTNADSQLLNSIFPSLVAQKSRIENDVEKKLLNSLLNLLTSKNPVKYLLHLIQMIDDASDSDDITSLLQYVAEINKNHGEILPKHTEVSDSFINIAEKIIGGSNIELMSDTLDLLLKIPSISILSMRLKLLNRFKALAKFKEPYKLTTKEDKKRIANIFTITKCVDKIFSKNAPSDLFFNHLLDQVLPFFNSMKNEKKVEYIIKTLKVMANFTNTLSSISDEGFSSVLNLLKDNLPQTPIHDETDSPSSHPNILGENLRYTFLEPALIIFYKLCQMKPDLFSQLVKDSAEFTLQLQYSARCFQANVQNYTEELNSPESKVITENPKSLLMAFSMAKNIQVILRDLLKKTPSFTASVLPTWKKTTERIFEPLENIKKALLENDLKLKKIEEKKEAKKEGKIYRPPVGKYSGGQVKNQNQFSNFRNRMNNESFKGFRS